MVLIHLYHFRQILHILLNVGQVAVSNYSGKAGGHYSGFS